MKLNQLALAFSSVLLFLAIGVGFYQTFEQWSVVDSFYFCIVLLTTVGYGDLTPSNDISKSFTLAYALLGITTISFAMSQIVEWVLAHQQSLTDKITKQTIQKVTDAVQHQNDDKKTYKPQQKSTSLIVEDFKDIFLGILPLCCSIAISMVIGHFEGWDILDSFYYAVITVTTIGFGDLSPRTEQGKLFAIFYLPFAVISVANAIGNVAGVIAKHRVVKQKLSMDDLIEMDANGDGKVSQMEYLSYMLVQLGKVEQDEIDDILNQFQALDVDGSGQLDKNDLKKLNESLGN